MVVIQDVLQRTLCWWRSAPLTRGRRLHSLLPALLTRLFRAFLGRTVPWLGFVTTSRWLKWQVWGPTNTYGEREREMRSWRWCTFLCMYVMYIYIIFVFIEKEMYTVCIYIYIHNYLYMCSWPLESYMYWCIFAASKNFNPKISDMNLMVTNQLDLACPLPKRPLPINYSTEKKTNPDTTWDVWNQLPSINWWEDFFHEK